MRPEERRRRPAKVQAPFVWAAARSLSGDYQHVAMSLEQRLDELEQPKAHLVELTAQTLPIRVYGSAWFHRLLPDPVALRLAALRGRLEWFVVPRRRAEALALTRAIRGVASTRFARGRLIEDAVRAKVQWRPSLYRRIPVEGLEHFQAARARSGGAVILANVHVGPFLGLVRGWRFGIIGEPIDPAGFDDPATLTRHLVAVQAPVFLQEAEQVHTHAIDVWDDAVARLTRPKVGR